MLTPPPPGLSNDGPQNSENGIVTMNNCVFLVRPVFMAGKIQFLAKGNSAENLGPAVCPVEIHAR
jgi:hypothetical protein